VGRDRRSVVEVANIRCGSSGGAPWASSRRRRRGGGAAGPSGRGANGASGAVTQRGLSRARFSKPQQQLISAAPLRRGGWWQAIYDGRVQDQV